MALRLRSTRPFAVQAVSFALCSSAVCGTDMTKNRDKLASDFDSSLCRSCRLPSVLFVPTQMTLMSSLQTRLRNFRGHLEAEEKASVKVRGLHVPQY